MSRESSLVEPYVMQNDTTNENIIQVLIMILEAQELYSLDYELVVKFDINNMRDTIILREVCF